MNLGWNHQKNRYLFNKRHFGQKWRPEIVHCYRYKVVFSPNFRPPQGDLKMKTVISANIPVELALRLKGKTKGTRSRVIERSLRAYLDAKESFDISDIPTRQLLACAHGRKDISDTLKMAILMELSE